MKSILTAIILFLSRGLYGQDFETGKSLFKSNCAACHKMDKRAVGPALKDVVKNQGRDWTKEWIYNSQALIKSGDKHANDVYEEYNQMAMPSYSYLKDSELESLVTYLEDYNKVKEEKKAAATASQPATTTTVVQPQSQPLSTYVWALIILTGLVLIVTMYAVNLGMKTITHYAIKHQSINKRLMNKLGLNSKDLEKEFDEYLDEEIDKGVKEKVKRLKKEINEKLNKFN
jgi:cytochrome c2